MCFFACEKGGENERGKRHHWFYAIKPEGRNVSITLLSISRLDIVCVCDLGEVFVNLRRNIIPDSNMRIRPASVAFFSLHIMNFRASANTF